MREKLELSLYEYIVCDSIHQLSHQYPTTKSVRKIGDFLSIDFSTVSRCINRLIEIGLIERVGDGLKTSEKWFYEVVSEKRDFATTVAESNKTLQGATKSVAQSNASIINIYKENKEVLRVISDEDNTKKTQPHSSSLAGFETWFLAYPLHIRKVEASAVWRELTSEEREKAYKDTVSRRWPSDPKYIPNPLSYLKGKRWLDEPPEKKKIKSYG